MRTPDLRDRHVIVTGGSSGIGLALARRAVSLGAKVSVVALDDADLARIRDAPPEGAHPVHLAPADVAVREQVSAAIVSALERHGPPDVLVTCAGVVHPGYFEDLADGVFERDMAIDYFGTLWCIRAVLPAMLERGEGTIACISSFAGLVGVFGMGAYCPPKYAVRGLCETLRTELKPRGIHVASVYPTDVDTPGLAAEIPQHPPEQDAMQGKIKPISPEVVVDAILDGIARRRKRIYPGGWNWFLARLGNGVPWVADRIADRAVAKAATRRPAAHPSARSRSSPSRHHLDRVRVRDPAVVPHEVDAASLGADDGSPPGVRAARSMGGPMADDLHLETERLLLRPLTPDDLDEVATLFGDAEALVLWGGPLDRDGAKAWIERNVARYTSHGFGRCAVIWRETGELVGDAGLIPTIVEDEDVVELGWVTRQSHWGMGVATEAGAAWRDHAFDVLGLERIVSMISAENVASRRVAEKLGFTVEREAMWGDLPHLMYALRRVDRPR